MDCVPVAFRSAILHVGECFQGYWWGGGGGGLRKEGPSIGKDLRKAGACWPDAAVIFRNYEKSAPWLTTNACED